MKAISSRSVFVGLIVSMMLMGAVAPFAAAAVTPNQSADTTQNPYLQSDVTKSTHDMAEFGAGDSGVLKYYDDNGQTQSLNAVLPDEDNANPVTYTPSHISATDYNKFPRDDETTTAVNSSEWSAPGANASVADRQLGQADAVGIDVDQTTGYSETVTFNTFTIDTDEEKRMFQIAGDVNELSTGTTVSIRAVDADGDYKELTADTAGNASTDSVWADSTGDSFVTQVRMGDLSTAGSGSGTFDTIEKIEVVVTDGNFDGSLSLVNLEKMSTYDYGTQMVDDNGDGDKNTESDLTQPNGAVAVSGLDTLGSTFDDAKLYNIQFTAEFNAAESPDEDSQANFSDAGNYQTYDHIAEQHNRLKLPSAYDLAYANSKLMADMALPESRYINAKYVLSAGETEFDSLDENSWTADVSDSYTGTEDVELVAGINPGETVIVYTESLITDDEKNDMTVDESAQESGGGGMFDSGGDGPVQTYILSPLGGAVAAILGFLGLRGRGS